MLTKCVLVLGMAIVVAACGSDAAPPAQDIPATATTTTAVTPVATTAPVTPEADDADTDQAEADQGETAAEIEAPVQEPTEAPATSAETSLVSFTAEVWADNWFALYANGEVVGEDSVAITTERSFNSETITFEASLPLTLAIEAKDFKETDSGIEYIGLNNQQMGDGGIIVQVTNTATGQVVATSDADWRSLVVHRAPLNPECERDPDPDATCLFEIIDTPGDWATPAFDDTQWQPATVWTEADVRPKDGYDQVAWDSSAQLIWGTDLEIDNTVLLRWTIGSE